MYVSQQSGYGTYVQIKKSDIRFHLSPEHIPIPDSIALALLHFSFHWQWIGIKPTYEIGDHSQYSLQDPVSPLHQVAWAGNFPRHIQKIEMEELENIAKQTGTAILDFDGKVIKVIV